jgi:hypothetical protein
MTYCAVTEGMREKMIIKNWEVNVGLDIAIKENLFSYRNGYMLPCWSLAALLSVLPKTINFGYENDSTFVLKPLENGNYLADFYEVAYVKDNPIDACVAIIEKLNELNLL